MINNGFVYAMDKWGAQKRKDEARKADRGLKVREILQKHNRDIDSITKAELTKAEYKRVTDYLTKDCGYPLRLYPNLL